MDEVIAIHQQWLAGHLTLVYSATAGALLRFLLVQKEPVLSRLQNALAGIILALVLAPVTAEYLSESKYEMGYALFYGVVARELVVSLIDTVQEYVVPLYQYFFDKLPIGKNKGADK